MLSLEKEGKKEEGVSPSGREAGCGWIRPPTRHAYQPAMSVLSGVKDLYIYVLVWGH